MVFSVKQYLEEERDEDLLHWLWKALLAFILAATLLGRSPYGRYREEKSFVSWLTLSWARLPARLGWFVMECPSLAVPLYLLFGVGGRYVGGFNPNTVLLSMFTIHYINRCSPKPETFSHKSSISSGRVYTTCVVLLHSCAFTVLFSLIQDAGLFTNSAKQVHTTGASANWDLCVCHQRILARAIPY